MNKKFLIIILLVIVLLGAGYLVNTLRIRDERSLPAPAPVGYEKDRTSEKFEPINEPVIEDVPLDETGFPDEQIVLIQPKNGSKIIVQLTNRYTNAFRFRIVHTPEGEWPDDPERVIEPNGIYPIFADSVGQYTLQSVENPEQTFTITVEKE